MSQLADRFLLRDEKDPFAPVKPRNYGRGRVAEALPSEWLRGFMRRKKQDSARISVEARLRAADRVPEAVVKVASYGGGKASAVDQMDYISREGELQLELNDGTVLDGKEDIRELVDEWAEEFHHRKGGARHTIHMVVSAPPGSDREAVLNAGRGFASETFGENHPYALVRHDDSEHPHVHIIARMRGDDGRQFRIEQGGFQELRERFAEQCRANGIEMNATPRETRGAARSEPIALRKMRERGDTPEIDKRAADLVSKGDTQSERVQTARKARAFALRTEAEAHRGLARSLEAIASHAPEHEQMFRSEARKLYALADYVTQGGATTRPDKARGERSRNMAEPENKTDRPKAAEVADKAREAAEKTAAIARRMAEKLPEGPDRTAATRAAESIEKARDAFAKNERDRERDMKPATRDRNVEPTGGVSKPEPEKAKTPEPERKVVEDGRKAASAQVQKIREQAQRQREDKDRDRDRE